MKLYKNKKSVYILLMTVVLLYRALILVYYSFNYVDDDQALMWYGTAAFAHLDFYEPCFFGQAYGSMIESLLAVPFYLIGIPLNIALPVSTVILSSFPFIYLGIKSFSNGKRLTAYIILTVFAFMSCDWDVLTSVPRSFVGGFPIAVAGAALINEKSNIKAFIGAYLIFLGCITTNTSIAIAGMAYLALAIYNKIRTKEFLKKLGAVFVGNALGFVTYLLIKYFYAVNPEYNIHPGYTSKISVTTLINNLFNIFEIYGWFTPMGLGVIGVVIVIGVICLCIHKKQYRHLIMTVVALCGFTFMLGLDKLNDYISDSLLYGQLRMLLFVPYLIITVVYLCSYYNKAGVKYKNVPRLYAAASAIIVIAVAVKVMIFAGDFYNPDSEMYNSALIRLQPVEDMKVKAKQVKEKAIEEKCDVVVQIDDNRAFGYVCGAVNYDDFIQYNSRYDRRTWIYQKLSEPEPHRCLLVSYSSETGIQTETVEVSSKSVVEWLYDEYGHVRNPY